MKKNNAIMLITVILTGAIIGGILGKAFAKVLPILNYGENIGFGPTVLDLNIFTVTVGFSADLTVAGIIGLVTAIILYKRL